MPKPDLRSSPAAMAQALAEAATHFRQGRLADAEKICTRVLKAYPDQFDALHLAGLIKLQSGKAGAAYALIESALKVNPQSPQALANLGMVLAALNRNDEALATIDRALALQPDNFETLNSRGNVLLKLNRAAEALAAFERVTTLEPRHPGARINRGNALAALERFDEAVAQYDAVLAVHPAHAESHCNRGNALAGMGRYSDAIAAYERALAIRPDYVKAHLNRGVALQMLGRHQEALAEFGKVLALDKDHADAHHNQALALLTLGDYRRGFAAYEWRWQRTGMPARRRSFGKPLWLGEYPLGRKTILLHAEQGLGDTIQFVRYAPLLAKAGVKAVIEVQPELTALLARVEGVAGVVACGAPLPVFDVHCPLASLPLALKTEPATIPADIPYLKASAERIAKWRERIERLPSPRIAIAWSGRATHANDRNRSIALSRLAPLFALEQTSFVSIQRELRDADAEVLAQTPRLVHVGDGLDDFDDTAAVVSLVDLVISVDTSVVHLAAALGRPTWILLPFWPDWRWMLDRADSPWYPTARLFRQSAPGDWDSVIARVREELLKFSHCGPESQTS
jgi:tetratricopeptide (TPR) repeat protein